MSDQRKKTKPIRFIREICIGKTEEEILEAEENFREYLLVVKEICDRIEGNTDHSSFDDQ